MRHPFDGIIQPATSRREALQRIAGAGAAPLAATLLATNATAEEQPAPEQGSTEGEYQLYFVVPKKFRSFSTRRRADLGVQGTYLPGLPANEQLAQSKGYLAWLTKKEASSSQDVGDTQTVHPIGPDDVQVQGVPAEKGGTLRIHAAPYQWTAKLPHDSYLSIEALGELWTRQFSMHEGVKVVANKAVRTPFVTFTDGKIADAVLETIKKHPQVYAVEWLTPVGDTTKRLGEEGGATTLRIGEEGGVTTQALGEEGGRPIPRPSTRALGEEGGVTTQALGEEGGRPIPRPSTRALGEEGGVRPVPKPVPGRRPTTLALGEEGGRGEAPAILPKEPPRRLTTQALGEEGGNK